MLTRYKLYSLSPEGMIRGLVEFDAADDEAARKTAQARSGGRSAELWQGERLVATLPAVQGGSV